MEGSRGSFGPRFHAETSLCGLRSYQVPRPHAPRSSPSYLKADQGHPEPPLRCLFHLAFLWISFLFVYPGDDPSAPPALVGRAAAACQSGAQSPTGYFFSVGSTGIWEDRIDTRHGFSCERGPRASDMPSQCTLSKLTPLLLRSGCSDMSHQIHQGCFCTSAAVYSCRLLPDWIECPFSHCQIKASVLVFCSY